MKTLPTSGGGCSSIVQKVSQIQCVLALQINSPFTSSVVSTHTYVLSEPSRAEIPGMGPEDTPHKPVLVALAKALDLASVLCICLRYVDLEKDIIILLN